MQRIWVTAFTHSATPCSSNAGKTIYSARAHGAPSGPAHPVLALPITVRRELVTIVLYGAHTHGEPLDPDEIKAIAGLASAAAAAYDHLEADALRRESRLCAASWQKHRYSLLELASGRHTVDRYTWRGRTRTV